jgi:hypothetical protein
MALCMVSCRGHAGQHVAIALLPIAIVTPSTAPAPGLRFHMVNAVGFASGRRRACSVAVRRGDGAGWVGVIDRRAHLGAALAV